MIASSVLVVSAVSSAVRAPLTLAARVGSYVACWAGSVRSVAWLAVSWVWPNLSASSACAVLYAMMSASDFIGALAGRRERYASRSRLNSGVAMSGVALAGAVIVTVV